MGTLFSISLPIHLTFLGFINLLGTFKFGIFFLIAYLITGALSVNIGLFITDHVDSYFFDGSIFYFQAVLEKRV